MKNYYLLLPFAAVSLVFLVFSVFALAAIWPIDAATLRNGALVGDLFGPLNTLFSGLGFAGLLTALFLQQRQLRMQQLELDSTQMELRRQSELFDLQKFDESFFRLLAMVRENLNSLMHRNAETKVELHGVELLAARLKRLREHLRASGLSTFPETNDERTIFCWELSKAIATGLGRQVRYVETVACLVRFVAENCPPGVDKRLYWDLFAAQLTTYEAAYLVYQGLCLDEEHALRKHFAADNPFYLRLVRSGIHSSHVAAYLWLVGCDREIPKQAFISAVSYAELRNARKATKAAKA
jgi:hypothetical protein